VPVYKCRTLISTPHDLLRVAGRVPRLSSVYSQVKMLASRAEVPLLKIEREIARDAAICALLPRLACILYPALDCASGTVSEVLPLLGGERIKHLLLITAAAAAYRKINSSQFDMRRFWRLGARRALLARQIALETPHVDPTRAFVAGLLGDVGHLVLHLGIPSPAQDAQTRAVQCGMPVHEVEMDLLGFDYTEVGAMLVRRWHHCPVIEHAIEYQMRPLNATDRRGDAGVLHIATRFADAIEAGAALEDWSGSIRAAVWNMTGHTHERLAQIAARAGEDFEELAQALLQEVARPDLKPAPSRPAQPANDATAPIAHTRANQMMQMPQVAATQPHERKAG
jgi:HD-like signal output (HDOD) protein